MSKKCILPWIHLEANATGHAKPCCLYKEPVIINNKPAKLDEYSIEDIWNSSYMNNLRQSFLNNEQPKGCDACWQQENSGKKSKRIESNEKFSHRLERWERELLPPTYLDLKLGTVCNLKCRSCSTFSSYKWEKDEIALHGETFNKDLHSYWINEESNTWKEIEELIPYIEYIDFTGGEPFLIKKHFALLEKCVDLGYSSNIEIHYNTNGTILPNKKIFEIWKKFKKVDIMFSIDGIEKKFEYLRNPGKWKDLCRIWNNFLTYDNLYISICYSVTIFNVMYMKEFAKWFEKFKLPSHKLFFNIIFDPSYLNIQSLTTKQKNKIRDFLHSHETTIVDDKIMQVIDFMYADDLELENKREFFENTSRLDSIRQEDFKETFPELAKVLEYGHSR